MYKVTSKKIWGLIIIGGIITGLSYYTWIPGFLAWIGFIPFLYVLLIDDSSLSFYKGYLFGYLYNLIAFYWIGLNSGTSYFIAILSLFAAVSYLSLYWGLLAFLICKIKDQYKKLITFPFFIVLLEWFRSLGPLGFPWANIALTQIEFLPLIQIMDYTGTYGVSALVCLFNVIIFYCFFGKSNNYY